MPSTVCNFVMLIYACAHNPKQTQMSKNTMKAG